VLVDEIDEGARGSNRLRPTRIALELDARRHAVVGE
jgi:hypothetical protein